MNDFGFTKPHLTTKEQRNQVFHFPPLLLRYFVVQILLFAINFRFSS